MKSGYPAVHEVIRTRRVAVGLNEGDMARQARLSVYEYGDIELRAEESFSVVPIYHVKKICDALTLDFMLLFGIRCAFCEDHQQYKDEYFLSRDLLIKKRRLILNLTEEQLSERLGFLTTEVKLLETYTAHLESWVLENTMWLADTLQTPVQVLLDVECPKCHR